MNVGGVGDQGGVGKVVGKMRSARKLISNNCQIKIIIVRHLETSVKRICKEAELRAVRGQ
jgi:hypothetical protein